MEFSLSAFLLLLNGMVMITSTGCSAEIPNLPVLKNAIENVTIINDFPGLQELEITCDRNAYIFNPAGLHTVTLQEGHFESEFMCLQSRRVQNMENRKILINQSDLIKHGTELQFDCKDGYGSPGKVKVINGLLVKFPEQPGFENCILNLNTPVTSLTEDTVYPTTPFKQLTNKTVFFEMSKSALAPDQNSTIQITCWTKEKTKTESFPLKSLYSSFIDLTKGQKLDCNPITWCKPPERNSFLTLEANLTNYTVGQNLTFKCNKNATTYYNSDKGRRICKADGFWDKPILCQKPCPILGDSALKSGQIDHGTITNWTCNDNFGKFSERSGSSKQSYTCIDGKWLNSTRSIDTAWAFILSPSKQTKMSAVYVASNFQMDTNLTSLNNLVNETTSVLVVYNMTESRSEFKYAVLKRNPPPKCFPSQGQEDSNFQAWHVIVPVVIVSVTIFIVIIAIVKKWRDNKQRRREEEQRMREEEEQEEEQRRREEEEQEEEQRRREEEEQRRREEEQRREDKERKEKGNRTPGIRLGTTTSEITVNLDEHTTYYAPIHERGEEELRPLRGPETAPDQEEGGS